MVNINIGRFGGTSLCRHLCVIANFSYAYACILLAFMLKFKSCLWLHSMQESQDQILSRQCEQTFCLSAKAQDG